MINKIQELEAQLASASTERQKIKALNALAHELAHLDPKRALALAQAAFELAQASDDPKGIADSLANLSHSHNWLSDYEAALSQGLEALTHFEQLHDLRGQADVLTALCMAHWHLAEYSEALETGLRALNLGRELGECSIEASALSNIGVTFNQSEDYTQALEYFTHALALYRELGDKQRQSATLNNVSIAHYWMGHYPQALAEAHESLQLAQETGYRVLIAYVLSHLGELYRVTGEYDQALRHLQQCSELARELGLRYVQANSLSDLGHVYHHLRQDDLAIASLQQALALAQELGDKQTVFHSHQWLAETYESQGDLKQALAHYKQFHAVRETLFNEESTRKLKNLRVRYETETARKETESYQLKNAQLEQEIAEHKQAEKQALRFKQGIDRSPEAVFITDTDGKILYINPAFEKIYGYSQQEALGKTPRILKSGLIPQERYTEFWNTLLAKGTVAGEIVNKAKDGRLVAIEGSNCAILDEAENIVGLLAIHRDITERKAAEAERERLLADTVMLSEISAQLNEAASLEEICHAAATSSIQAGAESATLFVFDLDAAGNPTELEVAAVWESKEAPRFPVGTRFRVNELSIAQFLISSRENPLLVSDIVSDSRVDAATRALFQSVNQQSAAVLLLTLSGRWVGAIVIPWATPHEFSTRDKQLLKSIADQAAVAVNNRRLLEQAQARATRQQTAAQVSRAVSTTLDLDELLPQMAELIRQRFNLYYTGLFLVEDPRSGVEDPRQWAVLRAATGEAGQQMLNAGHKLVVGGSSMIGWCIANAQARIALDVGTEAVRFENPLLPQTRSEMALPLVSRGHAIGAVTIQSARPAAFTMEDITALQIMADQLANAIQNARLFEETKRRLAQLTALQETTKAMASILELDELLNLITQQATTLLQGNGGIINLVNWEKKEDEVVTASGSSAHTVGFRSPLEDSLSGWVTLHNQPVISNQLRNDDRVDVYVRSGELQGQNAAIAPLTIKDQVIGTLVVMDKQGEFDQADLDLLIVFANQAAIAIQNARLFAERARAEEQLAHEQYLMQALMDNVPDFIYFKDRESRFIRLSKSLTQSFGLSDSAPLVGKTDFDFFTEEHARPAYEDEQRIIQTGQPLMNKEERETRPDQPDAWVLTTKMPLRDQNGDIVGTFGISRNISDRKRMEEALARERNLLRSLIDNVPDYIYVKDTESRFITCNPSLVRLMGVATPDDIVGKTDFDFYPPELAAKYFADEQAIFQSDQPLLEHEEPVVDVAGKPGWISTTKVPLRDAHGKVFGLVGMGRDITERKQAEAEREQLVQDIQARAHREQILREVTARVRSSTDPDTILRTAIRELGTALGRPSFVRLGSAEQLSQAGAGNGDDAAKEGGA